MKNLRHNFSFQLFSALTSLLFPLVTFPYITKTLGPAALGKVNYVDFLANLVISLSCLGIPLYGTREIAAAGNDLLKKKAIYRKLLRLQFIFSMGGILLFSALLFFHHRLNQEYLLGEMGILYILATALSADWYLQGEEAFGFMAWRNFGLRLAGLAAIFLLVHSENDYGIYYAIMALVQVMGLVLNLFYIKPGRGSAQPLQEPGLLKLLFTLFIATTFISIFDYIDTVLLSWLSEDKNVGYYTASMKLVRLSLLLLLALNVILYPRLSSLHARSGEEKAGQLMDKSLRFVMMMGIPAAVLFAGLAPELIALFAGSSFGPSVPVIRWLSVLPLIVALGNMFLYYHISGKTELKRILPVVSTGITLSLLLNSMLIPLMQEQGAAIASLLTESVVMILLGRLARIRIPYTAIGQSLAASIIFIPLIFLGRSWFGSALPTLLLTLLPGGLIYFILLLLMKNESVRAVLQYLGSLRQNAAGESDT